MYPSKLPARVQAEICELTKTVMKHTGYDNSAFNVEFFWDEVQDQIWLLEINTRIAQSHCDLFEKVDGVSHQQVTVDLGLGRRPQMPVRQGGYGVAAEFFYRVFFRNARVASVPAPEELAAAAEKVPGTMILPQVTEGMWLSDLTEQDAYSFAVTCVWMGANKQSSLLSELRASHEGADLRLLRNRGVGGSASDDMGTRDGRRQVGAKDESGQRVPASGPRDRACRRADVRRLPAGCPRNLAARRRQACAGPSDPRIHPLPQERSGARPRTE